MELTGRAVTLRVRTQRADEWIVFDLADVLELLAEDPVAAEAMLDAAAIARVQRLSTAALSR